MILYHGSKEVIKTPTYGYGRRDNDYGIGFYCTEDIELAKEWACSTPGTGYANKYQINLDGLNILDLSSGKYSILNWVAILLTNRGSVISDRYMVQKEWLISNYGINVSDFDVICGYRADDSYFTYTKSFIRNEITIEQLSEAMFLGKLGRQVCLKSKKAFEKIHFCDAINADSQTYHQLFQNRDNDARNTFKDMRRTLDLNGRRIVDLMRENMEV